ncbi:hypothetical protein NCLIV_012810 [Neospora caninum Liverpool]|uniref:Golgi apparatus membrane protein TVP38 n=1 Tax=Neospora caninum (strain Liverpool) TaxID=572307 RepID=F0VCX2_NEOCL|nr:hypothetical protein NCLIV_012810 [Neospora caninum Liverpool]CBZ51487.1 hypothetical protein NCLIV_012810 [Neospora caninum Liverpool]CEL65437.1 TPA: Golgi apparatus membrane protein TVP38 [Neospora caninum Liverpool]|eukprot:XP_003881520.1 hypothetical protein NCLIV_012810 [Neospora caninum Liverpool]
MATREAYDVERVRGDKSLANRAFSETEDFPDSPVRQTPAFADPVPAVVSPASPRSAAPSPSAFLENRVGLEKTRRPSLTHVHVENPRSPGAKRASSSPSRQAPLSPHDRTQEELAPRESISSTPLLSSLSPRDGTLAVLARGGVGTLEIASPDQSDAFLVKALFAGKIVAVVLAAVLIVSAVTHLQAVGNLVNSLLAKVQALGPWSPLAFVLMYVALVILMMPAEALNVAGGFIFSRVYGCLVGVPLALCCSMTSLVTAGSVCFLLSRHVCATHVEKLFRGSEHYYAFQLAVEDGGTCFVALIRLSPILPYSITSYLLGLTSLRLSQLVLGSFSSTPLVFVFNCVGAALRDIENVDFGRLHLSWEKALLGLFGLATATTSVFYISSLTRRKLQEATATLARRQAEQSLSRASTVAVSIGESDEEN